MPGASAASIRAGQAFVELLAKDSTDKGLNAVEAKFKKFGASIALMGAKLGAAGSAITAPFVLAGHAFAESGSALVNMANRTGVSVEALSTLGFAASQTGTDLEAVETGIRRMQKALVAGSEENLQAEATFASLGLSVENLMELSPEEQFNALAAAIGRIENPTARAGAAMQVFGKTGTVLIPLIENFAELSDKAEEFGLITSTETAEAGHKLEQSMGLLGATLKKIETTIGSALAPTLEAWNESLSRIAVKVKEFIKANQGLVTTIFEVGIALTAAGAAFVVLGAAIYGVGAAIGVVTAVLEAILSPIGLIVAGLSGLSAWFLTSTQSGQQMASVLGSAFRDLSKVATDAFQAIGDALRAGDIALAGQILWAGLKVEFLKGVNFLRGLWADWGISVVEVFRGVQFQIASVMVDLMAGIHAAFVSGVGPIEDLWTRVTGNLAKAWQYLNDKIADAWVITMGGLEILAVEFSRKAQIAFAYLKGPIGVDKEIERINKEAAETTAKIQKDQKDAIDYRSKKREDTAGSVEADVKAQQEKRAQEIAEIEKNRSGSQDALKSGEAAEKDNRRKRSQEDIKGGVDALDAAQKEFADLMAKAKEEAGQVKTGGLKKGGRIPEEFTPEGLGEALDEEKSKTDVAGAFQASTLAGQGVGKSIQDDQLKEQKKQTDQLQKLNDKARVGQLVFQ